MTDEKKITFEGSLSYEEYCRGVSSPGSGDLLYVQDLQGRIGLEVLWLKLSLLSELIAHSRTTRVNLSQCQISLRASAAQLPRFWNFTVEPTQAAQDAPVQSVLRELGQFWFSTLLANPGQSAAEVNALISSLLTVAAGNSHALIESAQRVPALQSAQLYVAKVTSRANPIAADLWQRVVQIGFRLATQIPNFSYATQTDEALHSVLGRVLSDVEAVRARVVAALFIDPPRMEQDLGELLNELIRDPDWLDSLGAVNMTRAAPAPQTTRSVPAPIAQVVAAEIEPDMESTIIMKRGSAPQTSSVAPMSAPVASSTYVEPPAPAEDNLEATIIISKDKKR